MKKLSFLLMMLGTFGFYETTGQWTFNGTHIYNTNSGNVGIGTSAPNWLLHAAKNMTEPNIVVQNLGGSGGQPSHENVTGLDFILSLRPVTYNLEVAAIGQSKQDHWAEQGNEARLSRSETPEEMASAAAKSAVVYTGFIAREVESAAKSIGYDFSGVDVPQQENGTYGLRYAQFVVPLVKAVQEQQAIIEDLQKQIDELRKEMNH